MASSEPAATARSAALRLKHDLGKYVRWGAPDVREGDPEALRARLRQDLLSTRVVGGRSWSAVEVYDAWLEEDADAVGEARSLAEVTASVGLLRELVPRIEALDAGELARLDALTVRLAAACAAVHREVVSREEGR